VGHGSIPAVAGSVDLQWSDDALADLNRFGAFLHEQSPDLAGAVAEAIVKRTQILIRHPKLGRPIAGREEEYRQLVLQVLGGDYVFQYRYDGALLVILRVFHAREAR
jgi:plasmid stabilization system protein ParE